MALIDRLRRTPQRALVEIHESWKDSTEKLPVDYLNYANHGYLGSGPVWACIGARMSMFSQVEFAYRDGDGTYDEVRPLLFRDASALLKRALLHLDLAGNAYLYKADPTTLQVLRPDWVAVVTNDREVTGYVYEIGGPGTGGKRHALFPDEVAHWTVTPDPNSPVMGQSWLTAVRSEILSDQQMQTHKGAFYRNAATPNMLMTFERQLSQESKDQIRADLERRYEGADNAYRTMVLDGSKVGIHTVSQDFMQMDFARVTDQGETRIASVAGVPPIVVGFNSGLNAATYSNYAQAVRRFADGTVRDLWNSFTQAIRPIVPVRTGKHLVYDDRRVPALQQDAKDDAEIENFKADTLAKLIRVGFDPDAATKAVTSSRLELLKHTGNVPTALYNPADIAEDDPPPLAKDKKVETDAEQV